MSDVIKNYTRFVIFEKNAVDVLPHWASFPALPYIYFDLTIVNFSRSAGTQSLYFHIQPYTRFRLMLLLVHTTKTISC